VRFIAFQPRAE